MRVGAHRLRPTRVFRNLQEFSDSMDAIGRAYAIRPYSMESIGFTLRILGFCGQFLQGILCF
jgi:hypothetical protein